MKNSTFTVHPIYGCLKASDDILNKKTEWKDVSEIQKRFLALSLDRGLNDLTNFSPEEMCYRASRECLEINKFLADNGFPDLKLEPSDDPTGIYMAAILKVYLQWIEKGTEITIERNNASYPGIRLKLKSNRYYKWGDHVEAIAQISTRRPGEKVFLTMYDPGNKDEIEVAEWILRITRDIQQSSSKVTPTHFSRVDFPMIDYDEHIDISWICGLLEGNPEQGKYPYFIAQALQQTRFAMNEIGAKVESAAAMAVFRCVSLHTDHPPLIVDRPFLIWVTRNGMQMPYFIGYFAEEHWKKPTINFSQE